MKPDKKTFIYIAIIFLIALSILTNLFMNYQIVDFKMIIFWGVLSTIVESLIITLPGGRMGISVGSAINLASIIVGGPLVATLSSSIGFLLRSPKFPEHGRAHVLNTPYYITGFNISQNIIVTGIMGIAYLYTGGVVGKFYLGPTLFILSLGTVINTIVMSGLMSLLNKERFTRMWITNVRGTILSSMAVGTLGIIMAMAYISYGYIAVLLFTIPLLLARHSFRLYVDMRNLYLSTIEALTKVMEAKDPYTSGHVARVGEYSVKLGEAYGLDYNKIENLKTAAILHDIGKIGIHDSILNKATKLTREEYEKIMTHPSIGADIINKIDFFKDVTDTVRYHHERYDGKGYPEGLRGEEIPIEAGILAIADAYDAMTSDRSYRKALSKEEALLEIEKNKGIQFHPELAEKFITIMK